MAVLTSFKFSSCSLFFNERDRGELKNVHKEIHYSKLLQHNGAWFSTRRREVSEMNIVPFFDDNGEG
jgi:hypothetical protein